MSLAVKSSSREISAVPAPKTPSVLDAVGDCTSSCFCSHMSAGGSAGKTLTKLDFFGFEESLSQGNSVVAAPVPQGDSIYWRQNTQNSRKIAGRTHFPV